MFVKIFRGKPASSKKDFIEGALEKRVKGEATTDADLKSKGSKVSALKTSSKPLLATAPTEKVVEEEKQSVLKTSEEKIQKPLDEKKNDDTEKIFVPMEFSADVISEGDLVETMTQEISFDDILVQIEETDTATENSTAGKVAVEEEVAVEPVAVEEEIAVEPVAVEEEVAVEPVAVEEQVTAAVVTEELVAEPANEAVEEVADEAEIIAVTEPQSKGEVQVLEGETESIEILEDEVEETTEEVSVSEEQLINEVAVEEPVKETAPEEVSAEAEVADEQVEEEVAEAEITEVAEQEALSEEAKLESGDEASSAEEESEDFEITEEDIAAEELAEAEAEEAAKMEEQSELFEDLVIYEPLKISVKKVSISVDEIATSIVEKVEGVDSDAVIKLAASLGQSEPAIEMAIMYLKEESPDINAYIALVGEKISMLEARFENDVKDEHIERKDFPDPASLATAAVFLLAHEKLQEKFGKAINVLSAAAFFANEKIPLDLIERHIEFIPEPISTPELSFFSAPEKIGKLLLVTSNDDGLTIDPVIHKLIRFNLNFRDRKKWAQAVADIVSSEFPEKTYDTSKWDDASKMFDHAVASATNAKFYNVAGESAVKLFNLCGLYQKSRGIYGEAKTFFNSSVEIATALHGKKHPELAFLLNNRGMLFRELCDYGKGLKDLRLALEIDMEALGPDNPSTISDMNNLGLLLMDTGDFAEAKLNFEKALKVGEKIFSKRHHQVAVFCNNLGVVNYRIGDKGKAKEFIARAASIDMEVLGKGHPSVAIRLANLASVQMRMGENDEALENYIEALHIDEAVYGKSHPRVAEDLANMAMLQKNMGDNDSARKNFRLALQIDETFYGKKHPAYAIHQNNYGKFLVAKGDRKNGLVACRQALGTLVKSLGENHYVTVEARRGLELLEK